MFRYPALIDGEAGAYGVAFPDLDGVVAMGETIDAALLNAEDSLRDYARSCDELGTQLARPSPLEAVEVPAGATLTAVPLIRPGGKPVRINLFLEEGTLAFIDGEAKRRAMTRTAYIGWMANRVAQMGG
ncbi:MAG: type II toxin-antitoxin system HicB family antitoxin [Shinella sp.]|uniref:type II toxin-antitoxin system HicB family antitoxin n=1 Tax=Shinella sp. TaxID=1870904 RepID=UPI004036C3DA